MKPELLFLKTTPEHIVTVKFVLESYEGLGIVRTLNAEKGEIVIIAPADSRADLIALIENLKSSFDLRIIPPLTEHAKDWLVEEFLNN